MKGSWLLLIFFLINPPLWAQNTDSYNLYYYINRADSLVGVKDSKGKIIIPARYPCYLSHYTDTIPITDNIIRMMDIKREQGKTATSYGDAYDRSGKLLYHPLFFDNGDDYFKEGTARCVENGKAGFVNDKGTIIIQPQWDWVSSFNYGYAHVCDGCYWNYSKDREHPHLAYYKNADTFYINKKGQRVKPSEKPVSPYDQQMDGRYYPYPFAYTVTEQNALDSLNKTEVISRIAFMNYYPLREGREKYIRFEIPYKTTGNPDAGITVMGYDWQGGYFSGRDDLIFHIDTNGNWYYMDMFDGAIPFRKWVKQSLEECKAFFRKNTDAPNKFDTDQYLSKW